MKPTSTRTQCLSLGFCSRCLLAFAVLLPALLSGVATARAQAPIFDWANGGGTVEVSQDGSSPSSSSFTLSLKAGESKTYYLRLTKPLPANEKGWWVRIHVNGAVRTDGVYPDGTDRYDENNLPDISWVPGVGWQFDPWDWDAGKEKSQAARLRRFLCEDRHFESQPEPQSQPQSE